MRLQASKYPDLAIPVILAVLADSIFSMSGTKTEGIFRVPAAASHLKSLTEKINAGDYDMAENTNDVFAVCALLKSFLRDAPMPLIPEHLYQKCIDSPSQGMNAFLTEVSTIHQVIGTYVVGLIRELIKPEVVELTKMNLDNLAMVFSPGFLRSSHTDFNQMVSIAEKEKLFVKYLVENLPRSKPFVAYEKVELVCPQCGGNLDKGEPKTAALGKLWHPHHFTCHACTKQINNAFRTIQKHPYHPECFCPNCEKPFLGKETKMSALGRLWHRHCFVCTACQLPFTKSFAAVGDRPYHVRCPAFNGSKAKVLIPAPAASSEMLPLSKGDTIYVTDIKYKLEDQKGITGRTILCYSNGQQGTVNSNSLEFAEEDTEKHTDADYSALLEIIVAEYEVATAIAASLAREEFVNAGKILIALFESRGTTLGLVKSLIQSEIHRTVSETTLFRSNSIASSIMTAYFMEVGKGYLKKTLQSIMIEVIQKPTIYEIDPRKCSADEAPKNVENLISMTQRFLNAIMGSVADCPNAIKNVCHILATEVVTKFPNSKYIVISGFYFLRSFIPAIVSPDGFGILDEVPVNARRPLVLISKVLQNVANGQDFKEDFMLPLNLMIQNNQSNIKAYFDSLSSNYYPPTTSPTRAPLLQCTTAEMLQKFHFQISTKLSSVGTHLTSTSKFDSLLAIMSVIGPPKVKQ